MKNILGSIAIVLVVSSCGDTSSTGDSDRPTSIDDTGPVVINFPDTFMNIAFKCLGKNGLYSHTRPGSPVVIVNDPMCSEPGDG